VPRPVRFNSVARCLLLALGIVTLAAASVAQDMLPPPDVTASGPAARGRVVSPAGSVATRAVAPVVRGRLDATQLGLVINDDDPYSVEVGAYYIKARGLSDRQVLHVRLPVRGQLNAAQFEVLDSAIRAHFGPETQALAMAWRLPFSVACNSITSAVTLGFDADICQNTCQRTPLSPYFNSPTSRPYSTLGLRPSILLAAPDIAQARAMIDRGVQADRRFGRRGARMPKAVFVAGGNRARNVRTPFFPPPGRVGPSGLTVAVEQQKEPGARSDPDEQLIAYETGAVRVNDLDTFHFVPGAVADHLTSFGGKLEPPFNQMSALEWIAAGATGSYGTVSEPCSHVQKFPHPQLLMLHYLQGSTLIEAYWKSVAWPWQGVFIGEPLAAPFAR